jgi:hypothetical protein
MRLFEAGPASLRRHAGFWTLVYRHFMAAASRGDDAQGPLILSRAATPHLPLPSPMGRCRGNIARPEAVVPGGRARPRTRPGGQGPRVTRQSQPVTLRSHVAVCACAIGIPRRPYGIPDFESHWPIRRARMSDPPPAANGTITRTGRLG